MLDDLGRALVRALAEENPALRRGRVALDDVRDLLVTLPGGGLAGRTADVLLCHALLGVSPPAAVLERVGAEAGAPDSADSLATLALLARWSGAAPPPPLTPPPELDWEALADWYARAAALAVPGATLTARAEDLVRGVGQALLANQVARAGRLLRWLALAPTAVDRDAGDALNAALERTRSSPEEAFPVLAAHAIWRARATNRWRGEVLPALSAPRQPAAGQAALIEPAIDWFRRHRGEFVIGDRGLPAIRKLGELGICGDQLLRHRTERRQPAWQETGREFLNQAWDELGRGEVLADLVEAQPAMSILITHYPPFHRHQLRSERLERLLALHAHAIPRPLALLAAHSLNEVGLVSPWTVEQAYAWSVVGLERPPWRLSPIEVYLVTHIAFYESSFGERHRPFAGRAYLQRWVPVWLRRYEDTGFTDLLAEMIFAWHCVEAECCPPRAWRALLAAQERDGSVPFTRQDRGDDYHSTLMALVAALQCRHG